MFDFNPFEFNPFEVGNPMTLGMLEENGYSNFVNGIDDNSDDDDIIYVMKVDDDEW